MSSFGKPHRIFVEGAPKGRHSNAFSTGGPVSSGGASAVRSIDPVTGASSFLRASNEELDAHAKKLEAQAIALLREHEARVDAVYAALTKDQRKDINRRCKEARIAQGGDYRTWLKKFLLEAGHLTAE